MSFSKQLAQFTVKATAAGEKTHRAICMELFSCIDIQELGLTVVE